jgi:uroporphyrinogen decarboxylase
MMEAYAQETGVGALSIDHGVPVLYARDHLQAVVPVQGNLDPMLLLTGGAALDAGIDAVCDVLGAGAFVFNLGHGIHKDTDPAHVLQLAEKVRAWRP